MVFIELKKSAQKALIKLPKNIRDSFIEAFKKMETEDEDSLDISSLVNRDGERLRIGKFRAIFIRSNKMITIIDIASRGDIYSKKRGR